MKTITASRLKKRISGKKMLIDTNIIIYLTDMIQPYEPLSRLIFNMIEMGDASHFLPGNNYGCFRAHRKKQTDLLVKIKNYR